MLIPRSFLSAIVLFLLAGETALCSPQPSYLELRRLIGAGKYGEAIDKCKDLIREQPEYVPYYESLSEAAKYGGATDQTIEFFKAQLKEGSSPSPAYYALGMTYFELHKYKIAFEYFNNAIECGNSAPECYRGMEYAYERLEGSDAAIRLFSQLCHRNPQNPNHWYGLGLAYWSKHDYERVKMCLESAIHISPNDRRYLQATVAIAYLRGKPQSVQKLREMLLRRADAEMDFAGKEFLRSFVILNHISRDDHEYIESVIGELILESRQYGFLRWLGWGHKQLSDIKFFRGEYQEGLRNAKVAYSLAEKAGDDELSYAVLQRELEIYRDLGDHFGALETAYQIFKLTEELGLTRETIRSLADIAETLEEIGSYDVALEYAIEALGRAETCRSDIQLLFQIQSILGLIYEGKENCDEALKHYTYALRLVPHDGFCQENIAKCHSWLGRICLKMKRFQESRHHITQLLGYAQAGRFEREICDARAYLGLWFLGMTMNDSARKTLNWAYQRGMTLGQLPSTRECARGLSILAERRGRLQEAVAWREKTIEAAELMGLWHERLLTLAGGNRELSSDYREYVRLLCATGKVNKAFEAAERSKCLSLAKFTNVPQVQKGLFGSDSIRTRLLDLQREILHYHTLIASSRRPDIPISDNRELLTRLSELNHLEMSLQCMIDSLRVHNKRFIGFFRPRTLSISEVQKFYLDSNSAVIEVMVGQNATTVLVITPDSAYSYRVSMGQLKLRNLVSRTSQVLCSDNKTIQAFLPALVGFDSGALYELYVQLLQPAISLAGKAKELIIVPDDALQGFPIEALVVGWKKMDDTEGEKTPIYLIEGYEIRYVLSVSTDALVMEQNRNAERVLLAVGKSVDANTKYIYGHGTSLIGDARKVSLVDAALPGVRRELSSIHNIFGESAVILTDEREMSKRFKSSASQYQILHLASHFYYVETKPLYSKMALSDEETEEDENALHAFDFLSLDLNADLVVLSGCSSGRFSTSSDLEGMTSAVLLSGVPTVIASLWSVNDETTATTMENFYFHLKEGAGKAAALRSAKLAIMRNGKTDPLYWAPFILFGNGGVISFVDRKVGQTHVAFSILFAILTISAIIFTFIKTAGDDSSKKAS